MRILDSKIEELQVLFLKMCAMVEESMEKSVRALLTRDLSLAREVVVMDRDIDVLETQIENKCIHIIATQQPLANDLRRLSSVLKIITDLERIGDYSVNIAKVVLEMENDPLIKPLVDLPLMAEKVRIIIRHSIDAWVREDVAMAQDAARMDAQVDDLYHRIYTELLGLLADNPSAIKQTAQLLFIGRHLERIADHATNICERVIYMVTGEREHY